VYRSGRTVIITAHRLPTVRRCDHIRTIERGRLVEDGSHDELIRTGGRYASLHRLQSGIHAIIPSSSRNRRARLHGVPANRPSK
jgi:ABC-type transport system involved in cytochrome bd biosynthesis fused ATPase/permease subunit